MNGPCADAIQLANSATDQNGKLLAANAVHDKCAPELNAISATLSTMIDAAEKEVQESSDAASAETATT